MICQTLITRLYLPKIWSMFFSFNKCIFMSKTRFQPQKFHFTKYINRCFSTMWKRSTFTKCSYQKGFEVHFISTSMKNAKTQKKLSIPRTMSKVFILLRFGYFPRTLVLFISTICLFIFVKKDNFSLFWIKMNILF